MLLRGDLAGVITALAQYNFRLSQWAVLTVGGVYQDRFLCLVAERVLKHKKTQNFSCV